MVKKSAGTGLRLRPWSIPSGLQEGHGGEGERMRRVQAKYRAIPTIVDGIRFASKKEAARYKELLILKAAGEIYNLALQTKFPIVINGIKVCTYISDFTYFHKGLNIPVVEDVKGIKTPVYRLKKKLMLAVNGLEITEVK